MADFRLQDGFPVSRGSQFTDVLWFVMCSDRLDYEAETEVWGPIYQQLSPQATQSVRSK